MRGQIFISYRREDSRWSARSLHDRLTQRFDRNQIFMDVDSVGLGEDFVKTIQKTVGSCDVLIAVIGNGWLISCDREGRRRLDNPEDFVRIEIATALKRGIRVIPVLVDGVSMPQAGDLPDDLKQLVHRNALQIGDTHFDDDCRRLMAATEQVLEKTAAEHVEREEKERVGHEPQAQPLAPGAPSTSPEKPEADKPSAETLKAFYPLPPKPADSEREKPPPSSSGGTGGKSASKQVIAILAIVAVLVVGALIYLAIRGSQSPPPQPATIAAVTPSRPAIATPTVETKTPPTPEVAVQQSVQPTAPISVVNPSPTMIAIPPRSMRFGMTAAEYQRVSDDLKGQGYRLADVSGYDVGGQDRYAAVWEKRDGPPWEAPFGLRSAQYEQRFEDLTKRGYRPVRVSGYGIAGQAFYAGIWEQRSGPPWQARHGMTAAEYQRVSDDLKGQGYRLTDVSGYDVGGQDRYAAIWEKRDGPPWEAPFGLSSAQYEQTLEDLTKRGYRPVRVSGYGIAGQVFYAGIWEQSSGPPWRTRYGMTAAEYQRVSDDLRGQGYRLTDVSGYDVGGQNRYAAIWEKSF
jgi:hypothetical protein